jgi:hypothetical protein
VNTDQIAEALASMPAPRNRQAKFLKVHLKTPGRALTASRLADVAGYAGYRGINGAYSHLARRVGQGF